MEHEDGRSVRLLKLAGVVSDGLAESLFGLQGKEEFPVKESLLAGLLARGIVETGGPIVHARGNRVGEAVVHLVIEVAALARAARQGGNAGGEVALFLPE